MIKSRKVYLIISIVGLFWACNQQNQPSSGKLFTSLSSENTGIDFVNKLTETERKNYLRYYYFYNGAGVAVGDINNDGLDDIYFAANQGENKLYLNEGDMEFRDITLAAGVGEKDSWTTGVTMVDINNDGLLDIYVCNGGPEPDIDKRTNRLFINNGDLTFTESAAKYNLNLPTFSIQSYFFDYDRDGDLDMYLVNHRVDWDNNNRLSRVMDRSYEMETSDYLFRNDGERFTDVTFESGIINKAWGLSASIGDFNNDGWEDIYVANDFVQADYLYINNQDGTFTNRINDFMTHSSNYSMGSDLADINNDGLMDLIVADMVPEGHVRSKMLMFSMNVQYFQNLIDYYGQSQYMSNVLQLNNGMGYFSEIGQASGINKTDWSWSTLFADFDQDGNKDLFVTNGIKRDITDNDYATQMINRSGESNSQANFEEILENMPSSKIPNYVFKNTGDLKFEKSMEEWGLEQQVNSNGVAYSDLDNDGDLDLVVNNIDDPASVIRNESNSSRYLKVKLSGNESNKLALGAKVILETPSGKQYQQKYLSRGYLSAVSGTMHFGLGSDSVIHSVKVIWPDSSLTVIENVDPGSTLEIEYEKGSKWEGNDEISPLFESVDPSSMGITFKHKENTYNDFRTEILLPHKQSEHGPWMSTGDVNGDGFDDLWIGGASGQSGELYIQNGDGSFSLTKQPAFVMHQDREDMKSLFFDADSDGDLDLYVVSGGVEFPEGDEKYADRLYFNDGKGNFSYRSQSLPGNIRVSGMVVTGGDLDGDGDTDLFVGGRNVPGKYPVPPASFILENQSGTFKDITSEVVDGFESLGLVNDAIFHDINNDNKLDLVVTGEWMQVKIFTGGENGLEDKTVDFGMELSSGWWQSLSLIDYNEDGEMDILAGNIGANNKFKPTPDHPLHVYANDMDNSGSFDIVLSKDYQGELVPIRGRSCASEQMPFIKDKFATYESYANASLDEIFDTGALSASTHFIAETFESHIMINEAGGFRMEKLPARVQFAPIRRWIKVQDYVIGVGNMYGAEVETVRYDAPNAVVMGNNGETLTPIEHGILTSGDTRDIAAIETPKGTLLAISRNNDSPLFYRMIE